MIRLTVAAMAFGMGAYMPAQAQDIGRYDKNIEKEAVKRVAEKIGELRGLILASDVDTFVTLEGLTPKTNDEIVLFPAPYRKSWQPDPGMKPLPPIVMSDGVDPFVTGVPFKFDSEGRPMANHQEYPRPTAISAARSLIEAIEINPFPGDE